MSSSGYGSQAVSTTNLTSDDSISIKSISVDETPDLEYRTLIDSKKPEKMDSSLVEETPEEYLGEINTDLENLCVTHIVETLPLNLERVASTERQNNEVITKIELDTQQNENKRSEMEISQTSGSGDDSPLEGNSVVHTKLGPGKVVRRRKLSGNTGRNQNSQHRASFPMVRPHLSESKVAARLEQTLQPGMTYENGDNSSSERIDDDVSDKNSAFGSRHDLARLEAPLPDWVVIGESVMVRPYSYCGVIAYVGPTEFATGTWIGVELDAPTGRYSLYWNIIFYLRCRC